MRAWATWLATMVMALGFFAQGTLALSTGAHAGPCKRCVAVSSTVAGDTVLDTAGQGQAQGCKVVADRLGESGLTEPEGTAPSAPGDGGGGAALDAGGARPASEERGREGLEAVMGHR